MICEHTSSESPERLHIEQNFLSKYERELNNRMEYYYKLARSRINTKKLKSKARFDRNISDQRLGFKVTEKVYVKKSPI